MRLPTLMLTAAALGLAGCTMYPHEGPYGDGYYGGRYGDPYGDRYDDSYGSARITVSERAPFGTFLVDGEGRSLYILEGTRGTAGDRCSGECLDVWPPLHADAPPVAGGGLDSARLSTVMAHGAPHVTYDGWPLYYYHRDRGPGDTTGQAVHDRWGAWHLLSPSGEPIRPDRRY